MMMKVLGFVLVGTVIITSNAIPNVLGVFSKNVASHVMSEKCVDYATYYSKNGYKDRDELVQYQAGCDEVIARSSRMKMVVDAVTGEHKGK